MRCYLASAYRAHGFRGCSKIQCPGKTRFVVYCGSALYQSFKHYGVRYNALLNATRGLRSRMEELGTTDRARRDLEKRQKELKVLGGRLSRPLPLLFSLLTCDLYHMDNGFISGSRLVQKTLCVFFPVHLANAQIWWQLVHLGSSPQELQMHISDTLNVVPCQSARVVAGFRCRICGLLFGRAAGVVQHFRELHPPHETRENALYEPMRVVRPEHCFKPPVDSTHSSDGSFSSLPLAQPGAQVPTLEHARNLVGVFTAMLDYVQVGAPVPDDGSSEEEGLTPANWCAFVRACVKGSLWRIFPNWWSSFMSFVLLGTYRGCTLGTFEPSRTLGERM